MNGALCILSCCRRTTRRSGPRPRASCRPRQSPPRPRAPPPLRQARWVLCCQDQGGWVCRGGAGGGCLRGHGVRGAHPGWAFVIAKCTALAPCMRLEDVARSLPGAATPGCAGGCEGGGGGVLSASSCFARSGSLAAASDGATPCRYWRTVLHSPCLKSSPSCVEREGEAQRMNGSVMEAASDGATPRRHWRTVLGRSALRAGVLHHKLLS